MAKPGISDEAIKRIWELKETHTQPQIAKAVGTTKTTVNKILNAKMLNPVKERTTSFQWEDYNNSIIM